MHTVPRYFSVRGKKVCLQEVTDLVAVKSEAREKSGKRRAMQKTFKEAMPGIQAFEDAGWIFLPRTQAENGARVYVRPNGRLALGTNRLTVRVTGQRSDEEARHLFASHGLTVVDKLKFASNLYVVSAPVGKDGIETAQSLAEDGDVEFAEPELVESMGHR